MSYKTAYFCESCKTEMSHSVKMHSNGRCPNCGYKGPNACTICDVIEVAYQEVRINPFWKFWKKQFTRLYTEPIPTKEK